jgi:hypothetical protein
MSSGDFPTQLTSLRVNDAEDLEPDDRQNGASLTGYAVRWLDESLRGWQATQRDLQFHGQHWRAWRAWKLHKAGHSHAVIARDKDLQCSVRTVVRLLALARRVMEPGGALPDPARLSYDARLRALQTHRPRALHAYLMHGYRWRLESVADQLGVSVDTARREYQFAVEYLGDYDAAIARRFARTLIAGASVTDEQKAMLARENKRPEPTAMSLA